MKMKRQHTPFLIIATIVMLFAARALLAATFNVPRTFEVFDTLTIAGALFVLSKRYRTLQRSDWMIAILLGTIVGTGMLFATRFSPYPFFGVVKSHTGQALLRGIFTTFATLGGLVVMRQGGPVPFQAAMGNWRKSDGAILLGLAIGLPLAIVNVFALRFTQGQALQWQNPSAALLDALQPGIVEEVIYRFALWGLLWLALQNSLAEKAPWFSGLLAMLIHTYSHFDDLFIQSPLMALAMGTALALFWGLPPLLLARRRGLEAAIAFHWIQDVARFWAGY